jgi:hypothetical protein
MANVKLEDKGAVSTFTDKSVDSVAIHVVGTGVRRITATNLQSEIGGLQGVPVPDLDAVDGLASLLIDSLQEGEIRFVTSEATFYVWDDDLTPANADNYWETVEPSDKPSPGAGNGYWIRHDSKIPTAVALTSDATETLDWVDGNYWTLNNAEAGGITLTIADLVATNKKYYLEVTTNGNPLSVSNLDQENGAYLSGQSVMTLEFYKAGNIIVGTWIQAAYVAP